MVLYSITQQTDTWKDKAYFYEIGDRREEVKDGHATIPCMVQVFL